MFIQTISLLQGLLIGLLISIPLGPLGILTMKRTAEHGLSAGLVAALAASLIDGIFAAFLLFSVHIPHSFHYPIPRFVPFLGSALLFWYGFKMYIKKGIDAPKKISRWEYHFFDTLWLAFTNPSTYVAFGATALLLSPLLLRSNESKLFGGIGFFVGVLVWWTTLVLIAHRKRDTYMQNMKIQKAMGILVMILAIGTMVNSFTPHDHPRKIEMILKKI